MFGFFRRKSNVPQPDPINAFWQFWAKSHDAIARAIETRTLDEWVESISSAVKAIDPKLAWELGKGERARHYMAVSSGGDMQRRVLAERWLASAPPGGAVWEFRASKHGGAFNLTLELDGLELDFASVRCALRRDDARRRIHTTLYHPAFATLEPDARVQASFIVLDAALGEDEVERWIGAVATSVEPLVETVTIRELADAIAPWRADSQPQWTLLQAVDPEGNRAVVLANLAIKRIDHLLMDVHLRVVIPIDHGGLPDGADLEDLRALEDELTDSLGHDAVHIATETRHGSRTSHFHIAQHGPALARTEAWQRANAGRRIELEVNLDPCWEVLGRW